MSVQLDLLSRVLPADTVRVDDWSPGQRPARARRDDSESSHAAADQIERSGKAEAQMRAVLAAVRERPGLSSRELAQRHELDRYMVAKRLPDLERKGLVVATERKGDDLRWWPQGYRIPPTAGGVRKR